MAHRDSRRPSLSNPLRDLLALRAIVRRDLEGDEAYFDPRIVSSYFETYLGVIYTVEKHLENTRLDISTRRLPEPIETSDFEGRGYIARIHLETLATDIEITANIAAPFSEPAFTKSLFGRERFADNEAMLYISHGSGQKERKVAECLISLFRSAFNLKASQVRSADVGGYSLPVGAEAAVIRRRFVLESLAFLAILTPMDGCESGVFFELGARWGADKWLVPLLACGREEIESIEHLVGISKFSLEREGDIHQLLTDLEDHLELKREAVSAYSRELQEVLKSAASH